MSFVIWGMYHGLFTIIERIGFKKILERSRILAMFYTFFIVNIGWVLFRAGDTLTGIRYIVRLVIPGRYQSIGIGTWNYMDNKTVFAFVCAVLGMGVIKDFTPEGVKKRWNGSVLEALYCVIVLMLCLASVVSDTYNPFIYFQF